MTTATTNRSGEQIGVGGVTISPKQKRYVLDALDHNRLSYGPYTKKFEGEFARLHDRTYAMFCNSGTSALQVGLHALKRHHRWADGDEVIVPAVTFVASSNVVIQNRLTPVFVDVDSIYYELDPAKLEAAITAKTRAIMPVHLFGQPCDMRSIMQIAKQHRLKVIEDSCETMFVRAQGKVTGSWGEVSCFSTYVAHLLVTGVGGFATTDDPELAVMMKSLMNHGRDGIYLKIDDDRGKTGAALFDLVARRFRFTDVGYSYRATELESALGLAQLEDYEPLIARRQLIAAQLTAGLTDLTEQLQLPTIRPESEHAFMMYPLVVRVGSRDPSSSKGYEGASGATGRDHLVNYLESRPRPIETRPMLPLINQPIYRELFGNLDATFPEAHRINEQGFYIGSHPEMTDADISYIIETFHDYFKKASAT